MAFLGVQLVFSMIMSCLLSKLSRYKSFASWLLCSRLVRYLHPSDGELKALAGIKPVSTKMRKHYSTQAKDVTMIPKSLEFSLESARVTVTDLSMLKFYPEYQWLVDLSIIAVAVYIFSEIYFTFLKPLYEINLSMVWCILVVGFSLKTILTITAIYFQTDGGERVLCLLFGFFFLVKAMGVLVVDENVLDFGLGSAYHNFSAEAKVFLKGQGMDSYGPLSLLSFKAGLMLFSSIVGAFLTFPGLRLAKMHTDALLYAADRPFLQALLYINIIFPLIIISMWVKPITSEMFSKSGGKVAFLTEDAFESLRLGIVVVFCMFRFLLLNTHLQAHLNLAHVRLQELRRQAGRISIPDLQRMVTHVFYYLCVVALQYLAPLFLLLFCTFMCKTLGNHSWLDAMGIETQSFSASAMKVKQSNGQFLSANLQIASAFSGLRQVFTPMCFRGLFSFLVWWISSCWFMTSMFGLVYYNYFVS